MTYPSPYNTTGPYWRDPYEPNPGCPVCGSRGLCLDQDGTPVAVPAMPLPPFDIDTTPTAGGGAVSRYRVTQFGFQTVMQLTDEDAAAYGDAAVPIP